MKKEFASPFTDLTPGHYMYKRPDWAYAGPVKVEQAGDKLVVKFGDNSLTPTKLYDIPVDAVFTEVTYEPVTIIGAGPRV